MRGTPSPSSEVVKESAEQYSVLADVYKAQRDEPSVLQQIRDGRSVDAATTGKTVHTDDNRHSDTDRPSGSHTDRNLGHTNRTVHYDDAGNVIQPKPRHSNSVTDHTDHENKNGNHTNNETSRPRNPGPHINRTETKHTNSGSSTTHTDEAGTGPNGDKHRDITTQVPKHHNHSNATHSDVPHDN